MNNKLTWTPVAFNNPGSVVLQSGSYPSYQFTYWTNGMTNAIPAGFSSVTGMNDSGVVVGTTTNVTSLVATSIGGSDSFEEAYAPGATWSPTGGGTGTITALGPTGGPSEEFMNNGWEFPASLSSTGSSDGFGSAFLALSPVGIAADGTVYGNITEWWSAWPLITDWINPSFAQTELGAKLNSTLTPSLPPGMASGVTTAEMPGNTVTQGGAQVLFDFGNNGSVNANGVVLGYEISPVSTSDAANVTTYVNGIPDLYSSGGTPDPATWVAYDGTTFYPLAHQPQYIASNNDIVGVDASSTNIYLWPSTNGYSAAPLVLPNGISGPINNQDEIVSGSSFWQSNQVSNLNSLIAASNGWFYVTAANFNGAINDSGCIVGLATSDGSNTNYPSGSHGVMLLPAELAVDADRNGTIVLANENPAGMDTNGNPVDVTTQAKPFRFWVNNGEDGPDTTSTYSGENTVQVSLNPTPGSLNYEQNQITCTRDLENFARLWLYTKGMNAAIVSGQITVGLEWHSNTGDATAGWGMDDGAPSINIYAAAPKHGASPNTGGADYLTDTSAAPNTETDQVGDDYGVPLGTVTKGTPFYFNASTFTDLTESAPKTFFLFEAAARGTGRLVVTFNTGTTGHYTKIGEGGAVYMDLKDIKELYERWTVGDGTGPGLFAGGGGNPFPVAIISQDRLTGGITPLQYSPTASGLSVPSDPTGNDYILFVHGWNMVPWEKDAFAETMLKRLYWQGYKGKFGTFEWPTTYSTTAYAIVGDLQSSLSYDDGEFSAWKSAVPLEGLLAHLSGKYSVDVLAHSMGNVATGEALRIAGQAGLSLVNVYVTTQAAVPGHCYDSTLSGGNLLGFGPGGIYGPETPNIYNNWMVPTHLAMSSKVNFYNVDDYALSFWQLDQELKPDIRVYTYGYSSLDITTVSDDFNKFLIYPFTTPLHLGNASGVLDRYEIMAYDSEPRSLALGGISSSVSGFPISVNMATTSIWPADTFDQTHGGPYSAHIWHSAEFLFTNADMQKYWNQLLSEYGITPIPLPP